MADCPYCLSKDVRKDGFYRYNGCVLQSFECRACWRKFNEGTRGPFRGLHYKPEVVVLAVMLQVQLSLSAASAKCVLVHVHNVRPDLRTLTRWVVRLSPFLVEFENRLKPQFSDVWMIDEVFLNRHAHKSKRKPSPKFLYNVLDSNRQVVACLVSDKRDSDSVIRVLNLAVKRSGKAPKIISRDGCSIYDTAKRRMWMKLKGCRWVESHFKAVAIPITKHVRVNTRRRGPVTRIRRKLVKVSQNYVERYNVTPRAKENCMRGVKTAASGTLTFQAAAVAYDLFKPHEAHGGKPPGVGVGWAPVLEWRMLPALL